MNFEASSAQQALSAKARKFAVEKLLPSAKQRERAHAIDHDVIRGLGDLGLLGVNVPEAHGGLGAGVVAYAMALREIAAADAAVAVTMAVTNMVAETLCRFGTPQQRAAYVQPLVRGEFFGGAFALSEAGAGSDAGALTTRADKDGDHWRLNGQKMWISTGDQAGIMVVWARTGDAGTKGISCFLLEQGTEGVSFGKPEDKMGLRASHTVAVSFQDVRVKDSLRLGALGEGFRIAMTALDGGRIGISAQASGMGRAALDAALAHVDGEPGGTGHGALFSLADMTTALDAAWLLTLRAAWRKEQGQRFTLEAAMAKVFASETANDIIRQAMSILGDNGTLEAAGVARLFRDCRVTQVYEGTSEIQRLVISREVLKQQG